MITVGIPVLGRPARAAKVYATLVENSIVPVEVLWLVSPGDDEQRIACEAVGGTVLEVAWHPGPGDFARKHNYGHALSTHPYYFAGADDLEFMPGWDTAALAVAMGEGAKVVGTNDMANPSVMRGDHATHILFDSEYVTETGCTWHDGPGFVYAEAYDHQYVDNEAVCVARERGVWAFAGNSHVKHHHPIFDPATKMDDTYRKALAKGALDRNVFLRRQRLAQASRAR